jgi:cytoskeleton protein RodZ
MKSVELGRDDESRQHQSTDDPDRMEKVTRLPLDSERSVERRRLHLREVGDGAEEAQGSVGDALRATRLRLGEDLRTVAAVLRIRPEHLEALEAGALDKLPGRTYALGFLRSYADYLGLDADEAVARFKEETAGGEKTQAPSELVFPDAQEEVRIPQGSILIVGGLLLLGIWGGYYLSQSAHRLLSEDEQAPAQASEATAAAPQAASPETGAVAAAPEASTATVPGATAESGAVNADASAGPVSAPESATPRVFGTSDPSARVTLKARRDVWVRIDDTAAGAMLNTLDLRAGDIYRVPNKPQLILSTRDAGGIEIVLDGQSLGAAGASGQALDSFSLEPDRLAAGATRGPRP